MINDKLKIGLAFMNPYCSHHTRREKFNFSPLLHNILL